MKLSLTPVRNLCLLFGLSLAFTGGLRAADADDGFQLDAPQLDELMGPVALYPDALIAVILPASTNPSDIVLAQRFLVTGGDPERIDEQPWNDSVKALARYPTLIKWMDDNLSWTREVGTAFLNQPDDVMNSVQRLRTQARATGALVDTPQQKVVVEDEFIEIVPAQPDVIYVPYYDPTIVYVGGPGYYRGSYLTFGLGMPIGYWLWYDFNWRTRVILVGDRHHNWREHRDWRRDWRPGSRDHGNWRQWQAPAVRPPFARRDTHRNPPNLVRPSPFPGSPNFPHDNRSRDSDRRRPDNDPRSRDRNHSPTPANVPAGRPTAPDRNHRPAPLPTAPLPTGPLPDVTPSPGRPPRPVVQPHATPPLPEADPRGRRETPDNRDRDRRTPARPTAPMPEAPRNPSVGVPRPTPPESRAGPMPTRPAHPEGPMPTRQPPGRPEAREPRDARPAPPPPPPADSSPKDRDPRNKDKDVER